MKNKTKVYIILDYIGLFKKIVYSFKASKKKAVPSNDEAKGARAVKGNLKKGGELYELCNIQMPN